VPTAETKPPAESTPPAGGDQAGLIKLKLRKPILVEGEPKTEVSFREPTGGDIERCGNPVNMDFAGEVPKVTFDERKMTAMLAQLAAVPPSSIRSMHPKDWITAAWTIAGFFVPDLGT